MQQNNLWDIVQLEDRRRVQNRIAQQQHRARKRQKSNARTNPCRSSNTNDVSTRTDSPDACLEHMNHFSLSSGAEALPTPSTTPLTAEPSPVDPGWQPQDGLGILEAETTDPYSLEYFLNSNQLAPLLSMGESSLGDHTRFQSSDDLCPLGTLDFGTEETPSLAATASQPLHPEFQQAHAGPASSPDKCVMETTSTIPSDRSHPRHARSEASHPIGAPSALPPTPQGSPRGASEDRRSPIESALMRVLAISQEEGFRSFDELVSSYYTANFPHGSALHQSQRLSRRRHLCDLLAAIVSAAKTWPAAEACGVREEILDAAVDMSDSRIRHAGLEAQVKSN